MRRQLRSKLPPRLIVHLLPEAQALTEIAGNIMKGLRSTVQELRLQEIDDSGLLTSLEGLIADHNRLGYGKTQFLLEAT